MFDRYWYFLDRVAAIFYDKILPLDFLHDFTIEPIQQELQPL